MNCYIIRMLVIAFTLQSSVNASSWIIDGYINVARNQFAACMIGDNAYIFGGNTHGGADLNSVEIYNTDTHTAGNGVPHPTYNLEELTGVAHDGAFYIFGAYGWLSDDWTSGPRNIAMKYETDGTWTTLPLRPDTGSAGNCAVLYNEEIYVFGGRTTNRVDSTKVHAYHPVSNSWRYVTDVPETFRGTPGVACVGNQVYLIGGYSGDTEGSLVSTQFLNSVMSYNLDTDTWTQNAITPLPGPGRVFTYSHALPVIGGKIYCIGGYASDGSDGYVNTNIVSVYDTSSGNWSTGPDLPYNLGSQAVLQNDGSLYVIGGTVALDATPGGDDIVTSTVLRLDVGDTAGQDSLAISEFAVSAGYSNATVVATNTLNLSRYALQTSTNLAVWRNRQYRLARSNNQIFNARFQEISKSRFFRIIQESFDTDQKSGNWKWYALNARTMEDVGGYWARADLAVTNAGIAELGTVETSLGISPYGDWDILFIKNTGEITFTYSPFDIGQLSLDMNLSVSLAGSFTSDDDVEMVINTRVGGDGFSTADLEGTWKFFQITAPDSLDDWAGWMTSDLNFTSNGIGSWSFIQRSDGDTNNPGPVEFSVHDDGSILVNPTWPLWQMSLDKNLIVFVLPDPGGGNSFGVMLRAGGTGFKTSDLEGRWRVLTATVPDSLNDWVGWGVSDYDFSAAGVGTSISTIRSDGSTDPSPSVALTVADDGTITGGPTGSVCMMSLDKNMLVWVMNDGGGGVCLGLMLRN